MYPHSFRIDEPLTSRVRLHRADAPNTQSSGTLTYSTENGVEIACQPALYASSPWTAAPHGTLLGTMESGDKFTVLQAIGSWNVGNEHAVQNFRAANLIVGQHFETSESLLIREICCEFVNLNEWVSDGPFGFDCERDAETPTITNLRYQVDMAPTEIGHIASLGASAWLTRSLNRVGGGHETKLSVTHNISFCFDSPISLDQAVTAAHHTELLLTLLAGVPSRLRLMSMQVEGEPSLSQLLHFLTRRFGTDKARNYNRQWMPASYDFVKHNCASILDRWHEARELFEPVLNLLAGSLYEVDQFLNDQFLTLAQAIEGYCRIAADDKYISKEEFKPILNKLKACLEDCGSDRFREKAKVSLGFLNDFSLRDRLTELFQRNPWLDKVLTLEQGMFATPDQFCQLVTRFRNALTHVESSRRKETPNYAAMRAATASMRRILAALLLTNAGVDIPRRLTEVRPEIGAQWW